MTPQPSVDEGRPTTRDPREIVLLTHAAVRTARGLQTHVFPANGVSGVASFCRDAQRSRYDYVGEQPAPLCVECRTRAALAIVEALSSLDFRRQAAALATSVGRGGAVEG